MNRLTNFLCVAASGLRWQQEKPGRRLNRALPLAILLAAVPPTAGAEDGPSNADALFYVGAGYIHTSADDERGTDDGIGARALGGWWWERGHALEFDVAAEKYGEAVMADASIVEIGVSGYDYQRPGRLLNPYVMAGVRFMSADAGDERVNSLAARVGAGLAVDCCWGWVLRLGAGLRQQFGGAASEDGPGEQDLAETQFTVEWLLPFARRQPVLSPSPPAGQRHRSRQAVFVNFSLQSETLTPQARASLEWVAARRSSAQPILIVVVGSGLDRLSPLQTELHEQRLHQVARFLRNAGIPGDKIALSPSGQDSDDAMIEVRPWHP